MLSYNIKIIIISIILGTLYLIYNNDCDPLYININHKNIVLVPINFRSLGELSREHKNNHKHQKNELKESKITNKKKDNKNKNSKDDEKAKQKIPKGKEKENTETKNLKKQKKGKNNKESPAKSNKSSGSSKESKIEKDAFNKLDQQADKLFRNFSNTSEIEYDTNVPKCFYKCCICSVLVLAYHCFPESLYNYVENKIWKE